MSSTSSSKPWYVTALILRRIELGLTQREVARLLCTSQGHLSLMERGVYLIKVESLSRWAEVLGLDMFIDFKLANSKSNSEENVSIETP